MSILEAIYSAPAKEFVQWSNAAFKLTLPLAFTILVGSMLLRSLNDEPIRTQTIVKVSLVLAVIASVPYFYSIVEKLVNGIAYGLIEINDSTIADYHKMLETTLAEKADSSDGAIGWFKDIFTGNMFQSIWRQITFAFIKFYTSFSTIVYDIMHLLQMLLINAAYAFLPIFIAMTFTKTFANAGLNYVTSMIGIMAWPIGFAVVDFGLKVICQYALPLILTGTATGAALGPAAILGAGIGGLIALAIPATWVILGCAIVPFAMQGLLKGSPLGEILSGASTGAIAMTGRAFGGMRGQSGGSLSRGTTGLISNGGGHSQNSSAGGGSQNQAASASHSSNGIGSGMLAFMPSSPKSRSNSVSSNPSAPMYNAAVDPDGSQKAKNLINSGNVLKPVRY